jgi:hypothetical protein
MRFLVIQNFEFTHDDGIKDSITEPVMDFATLSEAKQWVNEQVDPTVFHVQDLYADCYTDNDSDYEFHCDEDFQEYM